MAISAISPISLKSPNSYGVAPAFQSKEKKKNERHPLLAVASAMAPGAGQFMDGRIVSGVKYITVAVLSTAAAAIFFLSALGTNKNNFRIAGGFAAIAIGAINHMFNIYDAYKGGK